VSLIDRALGKGEVVSSGKWPIQPNRQAATLASRVIFDLNQSLSAEKVTGFALLAIARDHRRECRSRVPVASTGQAARVHTAPPDYKLGLL
jgi:hypothetical protein